VKIRRKIMEIDEERCSGCGECVAACAESALKIINGKARLVSENYCDGLGACLGECPEGALRIIERESEEFDPEAVQGHLAAGAPTEPNQAEAGGYACPSHDIQVFPSSLLPKQADAAHPAPDTPSALDHWPVQIRLIPPTAPFLKDADLLVAADCTPLAYAGFHKDLLPGRVVMLGCPKFDDAESYVMKFAEIFRVANIRSITVVEMEVPCCAKLPLIVRAGLAASGKDIPLEEVVVSRRGNLMHK
jgi:NAD-dependent dihydropyrimidine dehydrogenase PreA subunit